MTQIRYILADPAGNITAMVTSPFFEAEYVSVSQKLMGAVPQVEQVGFITPPVQGALGRLNMAGGEFCGNAARCFGLYLARKNNIENGDVLIELSGCNEPISVRINGGNSEVGMPLPKEVSALELPGMPPVPLVTFPGITHAILKDIAADETIVNAVKRAVYSQGDPDALGILFWKNDRLTPVVYVKQTGTQVYEGSCGSGTAALGVCLTQDMETGEKSLCIQQPMGELTVTVKKEGARVVGLRIGGAVQLLDEKTVDEMPV